MGETSNVNGEETTTTEPNNIPCSESSPPPLPVDEPSLPEPRTSMDECVDEVKKPATNRNSLGETIFQLVAVPRHENEAKSDDLPLPQHQQQQHVTFFSATEQSNLRRESTKRKCFRPKV